MDKYEISLWEDYQDSVVVDNEIKTFLNERKLCVIGADTMSSQVRAIEPKLVSNINGTHTFTFKMYNKYTDNETGEEYDNPYLHLLINERKVKVFWKNEWYDLVIKKCQEDSAGKSIIYTCNDLFINELSKNGFELNFATDLENNIGTVKDLATTTLEGTTWQYDDEESDEIYQRNEEPVYEVITSNSISCTKQIPGGEDTSATIPSGAKVLVFYSGVSSILDGIKGGTISTELQVLYTADDYVTDYNDNLVVNGDCYLISNITSSYDDNSAILTISKDGNTILVIPLGQGTSQNYRAERLVRSYLTEYDAVVGRYVIVCNDTQESNEKSYLIENTQYTDPLTVVNIISNPNQYKNVNGWDEISGQDPIWQIYPKFDSNTQIDSYSAKSYLGLKGTIYNSGVVSNISYLTPTNSEIKNGILGGFQDNEKYVFRFKAVANNNGQPAPGTAQIGNNVVSIRVVDTYVDQGTRYIATGSNAKTYFSSSDSSTIFNNSGTDGWGEYTLTCLTPCPAGQIRRIVTTGSSSQEYEASLVIETNNNNLFWFEDIQFFKYTEGKPNYDDEAQNQRMNPGEINLQSIAQKSYGYYHADHDGATDPKDLSYLYIGQTLSDRFAIQYNNYEKLATINIKESNRFNILQSIAESFKCWVRFRIEHNANGKITFVDGVPQKFVTFKADVGEDNGLCFEYGIDLKTISRTIDSTAIATKVIVLENSNEFAQDGFCTITRSNENYSKSNFLLNFDYYVNQGLLAGRQLDKDLYGTSTTDMGYYYNLRRFNRDYDAKSDELITKRMDLLKQSSQLTTYRQYVVAAQEKENSIKDDVMKLASVSTWENAQSYVRAHKDNTKVQTLMNSYADVKNQINYYSGLISSAVAAMVILNNHIDTLNTEIDELLEQINELNNKFNEKYGTYIQEGTWQDESYVDDDKYYLDAVNVAYTSSRPQITYSISVLRISALDEYSSKVFNIGDICYMIDREYFGYSDLETKTPYKEKILVSETTSNFDSPEKDVIQVRNYKTKFDDLFQRIAASTQSLQYSEGGYTRAAAAVNSNRTLSFSLLQDTFDNNGNLALNASNQDVVWDETGITVTNKLNGADKTKIIAGGIFVSNDGGATWKNAVRGDGISADLLTAGRIDTSEIYVYDGNHETFRWDSDGLTAYYYDSNGSNFNKFVRHDRFGLYGYDNKNIQDTVSDFVPDSESQIWDNEHMRFALTWNGFLFNSIDTNGYLRIASSETAPILVEDFSEQKSYAVGDLCLKDGVEYVFTAAHSAGTWNNSHVTTTGYSVFSDTESYSTGDLVLYDRYRYRYITGHSAGAWNFSEVDTINVQNFDNTVPYSIGDIVYYNSGYYVFKTAHATGAWDSLQVQLVNIVDYILIYGGLRNNGTNSSPKFYITQNGNAFFNGALFTNGSITGSSLRIGGSSSTPAFQVDNDGTLAIRAQNGNIISDCVYFDPIRGNYVFDGILGANAVFTESLYAEQGDIAELTVDQLSTSKRIRKYNLRDTSDDNFIEVKDQYIKFITGTVKTQTVDEEEVPVTKQAKNRYGSNLYWSAEFDIDDVDENGYPYDSNGNQIYTTLDVTSWPVRVYDYKELVKSQFAFELQDQTYVPVLTLGAGDDHGNNKGIINKSGEGLDILYSSSSGDILGLKALSSGYLDLYGLRKPVEIDFSEWGSSSSVGHFYETLDGNIINVFEVSFDGNGVPTMITDGDGHTTVITWEASV